MANKISSAAKWAAAAVIGIATGVLTVYGKFLPPDWNAAADSAALWMVAAFFTAALGERLFQCVGLATLMLVAANTAYYPLSAYVNHKPVEFGTAMAVWYAGALAAGAVFGAAAYFWRFRNGIKHYAGAAMPVAVLWAESAMMLTTEYYLRRPYAAYAGFLLGACLIPVCFVILRCGVEKRAKSAGKDVKNVHFLVYCLLCFAAALPVLLLGIFGYRLLWWLLG